MTSPSAKRMRTCHEGKRRYDTKPEADSALIAFLKRRQKQGNPIVAMMRVYSCACGGFHFGRTRAINWDLVAASGADQHSKPEKSKHRKSPSK